MFETGKFFTGANYWASHAGTAMWQNWKPEVVSADFKLMAENGLSALRVFPLWPDFQPIRQMYGGGGRPVEIRLGEEALADEGPGFSGLDQAMLLRFRTLADEAQKNGITLIVGLVTGWMSGRLFVPPALEGRNPITDALSIQWQVRFVKTFIGELKEHPAIGAWDLGNECNCMGPATREEAWNWTASIANAIRSADPTRPIVSGMHSLPVDPGKPWSIRDQGELTDVLTTHPYPRFTPHANLDPVGTMRTSLHAAAETRLYSDLGRRPAFIEEAGTLGPGFGDDTRAAAHLRSMLYSGWVEDEKGLLWWCAFDQSHLAHAPYDWNAVERELGLFTVNSRPKPILAEVSGFQQFRKSLPFETLPPRRRDLVCVLSPDQDQWGAALGSYVLASQVGLGLRFSWGGEKIPESPLYMVPSLAGDRGLPRRTWVDLLARVAAGAVLYVSVEDAVISGLEDITGLELITRGRREGSLTIQMETSGEELKGNSSVRMGLRQKRGVIWGNEPDGNPAISLAPYGKGNVVFSSLALENALHQGPGRAGQNGYWHLWQKVAGLSSGKRTFQKLSGTHIWVSEHPGNNGVVYLIVYNLSDRAETLYGILEIGRQSKLLGSYPNVAPWAQKNRHLEITLGPWEVAVLSVS